MRKIPSLLKAILTIAVLWGMTLAGCQNPLDPPQTAAPAGSGNVTIDLGEIGRASRTVFPSKTGLTYTYTFTRTGGAPQTLVPVNGVFTLEYDEWTVEVKAYAGTVATDHLAASGSKTFTVNAANQTVAVELAGATETGTGTFSYRIQYPEGATVTSLTLRKLPELTTRVLLGSPTTTTRDGVKTISGTANSVPAGFYFVTVQFEKDGKSAGRNEVAHIYDKLTSEFGTDTAPEVFVPEDFTAETAETAESRKAEVQRRWNRIKPQKIVQTQEEFFDDFPIVAGPNYEAGKLKAKYLSEAVDTLNFCRFLAGVPDDVQLKDDYTDNAQHGMVVLAALNRQLNHYPPKPADMDQAFFDKGYKGTSNSNLFWHSSSRGPPYYTPALVVYDAWLDDSDAANRNALGHRRWALNPSMAYTGFGLAFLGKTDSYYAMTSTDTARTSKVDYDAICWPNGPVFPVECMEDYLAWSITVNPDKYQTPKIADVKVTVTDLQSGNHWDFYQGGTGHFRINTEGYGVGNCIIFTPGNTKYSNGSVYRVEVQGLKTKSGEAAELDYQIEFFSLDEEI